MAAFPPVFTVAQGSTPQIVFYATLSSDHVSAATGKAIALTISKPGARPFANPSAGATNATEMASGWYSWTPSATDTGAIGMTAVRGAAATVDDVALVLNVVDANNGGLGALPQAAVNTQGGLAATVLASFSTGMQDQTGVDARTFLGSTNDTADITTPNLSYGAQIILKTSPRWQSRNVTQTGVGTNGATAYAMDQIVEILPDHTVGYFLIPGNAKVDSSLSAIASVLVNAPVTESFPAIATPQSKFTVGQALSLLVSRELTLDYANGVFTYSATVDGTVLARVTIDSPTQPTTRTRTT